MPCLILDRQKVLDIVRPTDKRRWDTLINLYSQMMNAQFLLLSSWIFRGIGFTLGCSASSNIQNC